MKHYSTNQIHINIKRWTYLVVLPSSKMTAFLQWVKTKQPIEQQNGNPRRYKWNWSIDYTTMKSSLSECATALEQIYIVHYRDLCDFINNHKL